jgi:hypothetical protein
MDTFDLAPVGHGDAGDTIVVEVTPTDSLGLSGSPASDSAQVISGGLVVTTLQDETTAGDGLISLREAIANAASGDTVTFAPSLAGGTIVLIARQAARQPGLEQRAVVPVREGPRFPDRGADSQHAGGIERDL